MVDQRDLEGIAAEVRVCRLCPLHESRTKAVPGEGPPDARVFIVGEAPGQREDEEGRPFVGLAGRVLDGALREAGIERAEAFVTNAVKCRPPDNRDPRPEEVRACRPYLLRQLHSVRPSVIVTLGIHGFAALFGGREAIGEQRSKRLTFEGTPVVTTYHPAATRFGRDIRERLVEDLRRAADIAGLS